MPMAKRRDWGALGDAQRRRYERKGVTRAYYESGGNLQAARGHAAREHVARPTKRGDFSFSSSDRAFLARQQKRAGAVDFSKQREAYRRMTPKQRARLREHVAKMSAEYKHRSGKRRLMQTPAAEYRTTTRASIGDGGGAYDADRSIDFEYEGEYPDFDDEDIFALLFYH